MKTKEENIQIRITIQIKNPKKALDQINLAKIKETTEHLGGEVIESKIFANTEELLPIISFSKKATKDEEDKHADFVERMMAKGYTKKQVRLSVEWFMRYRKHN